MRMTYAQRWSIGPGRRGRRLPGYSLPPYSPRTPVGRACLRPSAALPAARRPRLFGQRGHGGRRVAVLAGTASAPPAAASPRGPGLRGRRVTRGGVRMVDRSRDAVRANPRGRATSCSRRYGCGSPPTATSPRGGDRRRASSQHDLQCDVGALRHHQPDLVPDSLSRPATVAGQSLWWRRAALHLDGGRPESAGWVGRFRCSRCGGGNVAGSGDGAIHNFSAARTHRGCNLRRSWTRRTVGSPGRGTQWRQSSRARSTSTSATRSPTGVRTRRRPRPRMHPTSCTWCGTTRASPRGTASAVSSRCPR